MLNRSLRSLAALTAVALVLLFAAAGSAQQPDQLAFTRAQHLAHGINTSIWFAQSPGNYSIERLRTFTTPDDLALIHRLGFDHIRLSIDPVPLLAAFQAGSVPGPFVQQLDSTVKFANAQGLAVILDIHPESTYKATLFQGDDGVQRFAALWRTLATHYASTDPDLVFFEIMNEPEQSDRYRWQGIENFVAHQIRNVAPHHTIIASAAHWDGLEDLLQTQPLGLSNIIYTFHDYEPFPFTHQGATWTDPRVRPLRDVPYPSSPQAVAKNLLQEPTLDGQFFIEQYGLDQWDAKRVDATVKFADLWSQKYHAPVYCGEFGVHIPVADPAMRAQWIHDMRVAFEHYHIGWAMWDYQTNFGVVTKKNGKAVPNELVVKALGLNQSAH